MADVSKISKGLLTKLNKFEREYDKIDGGRIISAHDGVLNISGLPDVKVGELLLIDNNIYALAMNLERERLGAILLDDADSIDIGDIAYGTGDIFSVPVGDELLGRVVNAVGKPIDGKGYIHTSERRHVESGSPNIMKRAKVNQSLITGIKSIDSMIPIGKGQRELIIGDRQTGKTTIAIDTIISQRGKDVICVYVAIGQKASNVAQIVSTLEEHNAMDYTVIVSATARDSSALQYIAPYSGTAIAEYYMYKGKDVLIIYDDLSKHAVAYRTITLLLKRPPGREAYPGDIFYIHAKLLERSAKLGVELGGGSLTALPIIETLAGDISAYIPTNVISITDGQIYLESQLFHSGIRPAINVGLSVSRVGGAAQSKAMRSVSSMLRIDLALYRELAVFAQFDSDLDKQTSLTLKRGKMIYQALKQLPCSPMSIERQIVHFYTITNPLLDQIDVDIIKPFMESIQAYITTYKPNILEELKGDGELTDEIKAELDKAIECNIAYYNGEEYNG